LHLRCSGWPRSGPRRILPLPDYGNTRLRYSCTYSLRQPSTIIAGGLVENLVLGDPNMLVQEFRQVTRHAYIRIASVITSKLPTVTARENHVLLARWAHDRQVQHIP